MLSFEWRIGEMPEREKAILLIAIDGRCGSGKTTLAQQWHEKIPCEVIPMDDFFLRPEQRTEGRLQEVGGNIDYERFVDEVLEPLRKGEFMGYRPFSCREQCLLPFRSIPESQIYIIEGSYSCHPRFQAYYDHKIMLTITKEEQRERLANRETEEMYERYIKEWIPKEEAYFKQIGRAHV